MAYDGYVSIGEGGSGESGKAVLAEMEILGGKVMKEYSRSHNDYADVDYSHNTDRFTNYIRRLGPLQKAYRHFESRLNAYIPARTSLSRLKIELHSSQCEVGWSILQGVSGYLEELELYHLDNSRPSLSPTPGTFTFERGILSYPWGPISPNFPNLTSLSIYCSSYRRPLNEHITPDISTMPTFENLKTLSVTGDVVMINNVLRIMAVKGKNIRQATIFGETGWSATSSYGAVELLPEQKNLEVLAIYGSQARTLSSKARSTDFLSVTSLLVETGSLLDTGDPHEIIFSPLLDVSFVPT